MLGKPILELIDDFIADLDKADATRNQYQRTLGYWVTWSTKNNVDLHNVTAANVINYKRSLLDDGRSVATVDNYIAAIRKFFNWMTDLEYAPKNPTHDIRWSRNRRGVFIKKALTLQEVLSLVEHHNLNTVVSKRNRALINLMSFTGLRCIEVARLDIGDIVKTADHYILQVHRKGTMEKSAAVPIPEGWLGPIREYWKYRQGTLSEDQPVFVNHAPRSQGTRLSPQFISKMIKGSLRATGLNSNKYTAHSLRHTAATLAHYSGSEYFEISQLLGHTNPRQTELYLHSLGIDGAQQGRATSKIDNYVKNYLKTAKKQGK